MILLKGFLKHKSSKIYIVIFTVMLLVISILFSFYEYYSNLITNIYKENSYFLVISEEDIFDKIRDNNFAVNIEKVVLLEPNNDNFSDNVTVNDSMLLDVDNNFIIVTPNRKQESKLENNQLAIEFPKFMLDAMTELYDLIGKTISLKVGNNKEDFEIVKIYESNFARVIVSGNIFEYLVQNSNFHAYTFLLNDYRQQEEIVYYFETQENVQLDFIQFYDSDVQLKTVESLEDTINLISRGSIVIIIVFLILFLAIIYNSICDELERMYIERLLGYNKLQIKKILVMKIVTLNLIVIFFYSISYISTKLLLTNIFGIEIRILNFNVIYIVFILFFISMFFCFLCRIKARKI